MFRCASFSMHTHTETHTLQAWHLSLGWSVSNFALGHFTLMCVTIFSTRGSRPCHVGWLAPLHFLQIQEPRPLPEKCWRDQRQAANLWAPHVLPCRLWAERQESAPLNHPASSPAFFYPLQFIFPLMFPWYQPNRVSHSFQIVFLLRLC